MIRKFRDNVSGIERFIQPQMHVDDSYQETQRVYTEALAQRELGPFPESEHQRPYENPDMDYPMLEYAYPPHNKDFPYPEPPAIDPYADIDCVQLWEEMFGDWAGGAIHSVYHSGIFDLLGQYAEHCPVEFIQKRCCKPGVGINGLRNVAVNSTNTYTYDGMMRGCPWYRWNTDRGWINYDGTYVAPSTAGPDWISIGHAGTPGLCDKIEIMVTDSEVTCTDRSLSGAGTTIEFGEKVTINASPSDEVYKSISIISGGGLIKPLDSFGNSVEYTAPGGNEDCKFTPIIGLFVNGVECVRVAIGVTNPALATKPAYWWDMAKDFICASDGTTCSSSHRYVFTALNSCNDTRLASGAEPEGGVCDPASDPPPMCTQDPILQLGNPCCGGCTASTSLNCVCPPYGCYKIVRSVALKFAGCCPSALAVFDS